MDNAQRADTDAQEYGILEHCRVRNSVYSMKERGDSSVVCGTVM